MATELKAAGKAVATAKGHYPDAAGRHLTVLPGQTFVVWEGKTKAKWFDLLPAKGPAPEPAKKVAPPAEPDTLAAAAAVERKRKAEVKPPTGDDIA